ncbi:hypothetical protein, partial [Bacteroides caecimuris]|uniref:hypothetical protein n=1 Tax=Bacteroides caecimuris TaxID=1796613 RepID=UPI00265CCB00
PLLGESNLPEGGEAMQSTCETSVTRMKKQLVNPYLGSTGSLCPIYCGKVFPINWEKIPC